MIRRRQRAAAIAGSAALTAGAFAVLAGSSGGVASSTAATPVSAVAAAKSTFAALGSGVAAPVGDSPFATNGARLGVAAEDVRKVRSDSGWSIWAAASKDGACIAFAGPTDLVGSVGGFCAPLKSIAENGLVGASVPVPGAKTDVAAEVVALVPDGVTSVSLQLADGTTQRGVVRGNTVAETVTAKPVALAFTGTDAAVHTTKLNDSGDR